MEGIEMEAPPSPPPSDSFSDDFCATVLAQFTNSNNEHHLHVCTSIGAMSQGLKDQNQPLTTVAYFGATCSSLHSLATAAGPEPAGHLIDALVTILSLVIDKFNSAILKKKFGYLSDLLVKILRLKSIGINGVVPALKCVSRLLVVTDNGQWSDVSELYGVLLSYIVDDRPKVRKQSHVCLREVLQCFQMSTAVGSFLAPASDAITEVFERFLLLAGGSNGNAADGPKGAQEVLHVLDALKLCLPSMSKKSTTNILKYFKSLLELRQPVVTRRITDALNALCLLPGGDISPEVLLDLLCSLAASVSSANESSADSMTFTARLLDVGMKRVYNLNRKICVAKLPVVFSALSDIFASDHEESLLAAMGAFKSLIDSCIDESLIKEGVDQVVMSYSEASRKSGPTVIEKLCATIESLIGYHYAAIWDMSFQVVSSMFDKLGYYSSYFMKGTLKSLADMEELPDEDFSFRKQLHECVGSALGAMGPETFLDTLPLKLEADDLSEANLWLFPILKQYIVGAKLTFFSESILPMVKAMKQKSAMLKQEGKTYSARSVDGIVYSLWSLLPSFCNYPSDTAKSFKDLEGALRVALQEEADVRGIICSSLQILIQQNKKILEGKEDVSDAERSVPEERAIAQYNREIAAQNLSVLRSSARGLLSVLRGVFYSSSKDTFGPLQSTIGELASISDKKVVASFFKTTMEKLLEAIKAENSRSSNSMQVDSSSNESSLPSTRAALLDLAVSLLPGLDAEQTNLLFTAIKHQLKDDDGLIQKKAYKVLSIILRQSDAFISRRLEELLNLMIELQHSYLFPATRPRLDCLYFLIVHVSKAGLEQQRNNIVTSLLTEIILALKEANKKTRNRAYDILVQIGHAYADEEKGGRKESLLQFFRTVAGGLALETPHMISAAVKGLARLAYEFSELISEVYNILPSTFLLLQIKNREVIKANLGLLKVLVAKSQADSLQTHLKGMVESLLNWQDSTKSHFKAKIKLLLEMLVKKCGMDAVKSVMPEEHMKLLTNIRKIKERKERKLASNFGDAKSQLSKATTSRQSRWNHTKIFSDFGDEDTENSEADYMDAETVSGRRSKLNSKASSLRSKKVRKAAKSLQEDVFDQFDDEPLDLLDRQRTRSALRSSEQLKRKHDSDDELEVDSEGRLIISDGNKKPKKDTTSDLDFDSRSQAASNASRNSQNPQKRRKKTESAGWAYTGKDYKSKKAFGDVQKKGKLEPYAYWPLDRKMVSRRPEHRAAARKGMASVVKLTKDLEGKSVSNALSAHGMKLKKRKSNQKKKSR